ncbi:MAG: hypothetical protein WC449_05445 [Candidatus Paceibacterota bacterium]
MWIIFWCAVVTNAIYLVIKPFIIYFWTLRKLAVTDNNLVDVGGMLLNKANNVKSIIDSFAIVDMVVHNIKSKTMKSVPLFGAIIMLAVIRTYHYSLSLKPNRQQIEDTLNTLWIFLVNSESNIELKRGKKQG